MKTALSQAIKLIFSGSELLRDIIGVTLRMSISSSLVALLLGVPLGVLLAMTSFRGKRAIIVVNRTLMGLPPVVCGLICYMLFSGVGPLRHLKLLYTVRAMVIAQVILITPIIIGNTETFLTGLTADIKETAKGLGLGAFKTFALTMNECKYQIISTYLFGFSRAIAEVGAVSMVGGAIAYKTNVMTTAIMNYTSMGDFKTAMALGVVLLIIGLVVNIIVGLLQWKADR